MGSGLRLLLRCETILINVQSNFFSISEFEFPTTFSVSDLAVCASSLPGADVPPHR